MSTDTVHYDDTPTPVATWPIERRGGVEYVGGTGVRVVDVLERLADGIPADELTRVCRLPPGAVEYVQRRAAKKAKRATPEAKAKRNRGRTQKRRGYRCEKRIETVLAPFGFQRMVMSGALGGEHAGDLRRDFCECGHAKTAHGPSCARCPRDGTLLGCPCYRFEREYRRTIEVVEVKQRQDAQAFLRRALAQGGAHAVVVDPAGGAEPLFVMTLTTATHLLREAGYEVTG